MAFNDTLKELRKRDFLTQEELAQKMGLSKSTISMYENGNREPNLETLEAFADFFNVDINYLTGNYNSELDPDIRRIQRAKNKMPVKEQEKMMKLIELSFEEYFKDDAD